MYGYIISLEGLPVHSWGCETIVTNYNWVNRHPENMLEISIACSKYLVKIINSQKYESENVRLLSCTIGKENITAYSTPETPVSVITIAVRFHKINVIPKEFSPDDCANPDVLLVPAFTETMSEDELDEINILMHNYIQHNERNTEHDKMKCYSIFYDILTRIDSYVRRHLNQENKKTYNSYVNKVNWIIKERYNTKLTESAMAKELGISTGYLASIYKNATGRTIAKYLLVFRMRKAAELLENENMPTARIAALVGFDDENYFRKKFKQYFGMNIKEYRNIKHGNTMYHDKPIRKN